MSEPFTEQELADFLQLVTGHMKAMLSGASSPYDAGREIWGDSFRNAPRSTDVAWPLWLLWGGLTDIPEVHPSRLPEAEGLMRRAAVEWLALPEDAAAIVDYFDRWLYEEIGYERPETPRPH